MAKYLDTAQISSELMQLIKEAKERIILVTYSLQVNTQIQERLKTKSKLGTLAEITLIYGNTKIKNSELKWMSKVDDLKVWQKKNLHAKCYINENKAIISSMNLYDYSQTNNVEMGFLITKEDDKEAYLKMMEDIDDLRINGDRVNPWQDINNEDTETNVAKAKEEANKKEQPDKVQYSYIQQIRKHLLEDFRKQMSSRLRQKSQSILSDEIIHKLIQVEKLNYSYLQRILENDKRVKQLAGDILSIFDKSLELTLGIVTDTRFQSDDFNYDRIKMKRLDDNSEMWYDTTMEMPRKNQIVAVRLNGSWFNDYMTLNKSETGYTKPSIDSNTENGEYFSTKELSEATGISSRNINSTLVRLGLMSKTDEDWIPTAKGKEKGAIQKEGQYGKFVIWPETIMDILK